jgi:hypothetical protein
MKMHRLLLTGASPALDLDPVTTPFEDWCDREGVHPEASDAWDRFERACATTPPRSSTADQVA